MNGFLRHFTGILILAALVGCESNKGTYAPSNGGSSSAATTKTPKVPVDKTPIDDKDKIKITEFRTSPLTDPLPKDRQLIPVPHNFKPVYFQYDSAVVGERQEATLKLIAKFMKRNESFYLTVEGHCDVRGTEKYNRALSERRAIAIKKFLIKNQVREDRINTVGYGEEKLADSADTDLAHANNRRAEFVISKPKEIE